MSDVLPPIGFWSYTRRDDTNARGRLSRVRKALAHELETLTGLPVSIFQDKETIPYGSDWLDKIKGGLDGSSFFIPIVTPAFLRSRMCCEETLLFLDRERQLDRKDLIFPIRYVDVSDVDPDRKEEVHDKRVLTLISERQGFDFEPWRHHEPESLEVAHELEKLARAIRGALRGRPARSNGSPARSQPPRQATADALKPSHAEPPPVLPAPPIIRKPQPDDTDQEGPDFPKMVLIPDGSYQRGVPPEEAKREGTSALDKRSLPIRMVTIPREFWLGVTPVTRGQFAAFVNATGHDTGNQAWTYEQDGKGNWDWAARDNRNWRNPGFPQDDSHPVVCINHDDAMAYVNWLNTVTKGGYRLPSEAEWEYAARARTNTARYWGDTMDQAHLHANATDQSLKRHMGKAAAGREFTVGDDGFPFTSPVGHFRPNHFGLHDMLGNVWEWCADRWHDDYNGAPNDGSAWTTPETEVRRVLRGGSWYSNPRDVRAGVRGVDVDRYSGTGCRLARTSF